MKISTKKNDLIDNFYLVFYGDLEVGKIMVVNRGYHVYILNDRFEVKQKDKAKLQSIIEARYIKSAKAIAESLGMNLVWEKEVDPMELKEITGNGRRILS